MVADSLYHFCCQSNNMCSAKQNLGVSVFLWQNSELRGFYEGVSYEDFLLVDH